MADPETRTEEKCLTPKEVEEVWGILHRNMKEDDRYPEVVAASPPWNGDRVAYCNAMRYHLDSSAPY